MSGDLAELVRSILEAAFWWLCRRGWIDSAVVSERRQLKLDVFDPEVRLGYARTR